MWEKELARIRNKSYVDSPKVTGMPKVTGTSDKTAERSLLELEYEKLIEQLRTVAALKKNEILNFISTIELSSDRQIVFLRAAALLHWSVIADELGGDNTEDAVRKRYDRLFDKK